ncbi:MAG: TM2 domain-containing protein [Clostridia bacterium]|nr:TM2 domain-containing protein [Clostridia bacterium]
MYCKYCGHELPNEVNYCPNCGAKTSEDGEQYQRETRSSSMSDRKLILVLLTIFLGMLGVPRFVNGKIGTGIIWLLTGGCFGIGWIVDIVKVSCSEDGYF